MSKTTPKRKGAMKPADVPPGVLAALERGEDETVNLSEGLAVDFAKLMGNIFPNLANQAKATIDPKAGITKRMASAAALLSEAEGAKVIDKVIAHPSDTARGWAAYVIAQTPEQTLANYMDDIRPLANDPHFGVREWAWLAVRPHIVADPKQAIAMLTPWTADPSEYIRRFAIEAIRPRGVWSSHIKVLKTNPALGLPLLEPLKSDPARYVQDSVANWLNDAFKSQPDWVEETCARWSKESKTVETAYIAKRALRSRK